MGDYNRGGDRGGFRDSRGGGSRFGGGRSGGGFGGSRGGGSRFGDREVVMHDAVCDDCKKDCQIPFKPSSDKPVYCKDCFNKRGGPAGRGSDSAPRRDFNSRPQNDFNSAPARAGGNDDIKKQLESMNVKLDRLISAIEGKVKPVSTPVVKTEEKKVVEKTSEKAKAPAKKKVSKK
jgi:CxxC-x17-CxxC domain-containing protein